MSLFDLPFCFLWNHSIDEPKKSEFIIALHFHHHLANSNELQIALIFKTILPSIHTKMNMEYGMHTVGPLPSAAIWTGSFSLSQFFKMIIIIICIHGQTLILCTEWLNEFVCKIFNLTLIVPGQTVLILPNNWNALLLTRTPSLTNRSHRARVWCKHPHGLQSHGDRLTRRRFEGLPFPRSPVLRYHCRCLFPPRSRSRLTVAIGSNFLFCFVLQYGIPGRTLLWRMKKRPVILAWAHCLSENEHRENPFRGDGGCAYARIVRPLEQTNKCVCTRNWFRLLWVRQSQWFQSSDLSANMRPDRVCGVWMRVWEHSCRLVWRWCEWRKCVWMGLSRIWKMAIIISFDVFRLLLSGFLIFACDADNGLCVKPQNRNPYIVKATRQRLRMPLNLYNAKCKLLRVNLTFFFSFFWSMEWVSSNWTPVAVRVSVSVSCLAARFPVLMNYIRLPNWDWHLFNGNER